MVKMRHTGITITNLDKAVRFYGGFFGFKIVKRMDESGEFIDKISGLKKARVTTVKMVADDGNLIELLYYHSHSRPRRGKSKICAAGLSHIAFTVEDLDAEFKRLKRAGVRFNSSPRISPDGYAKVVFCRDFDNNLVELVEVL